LSPAFPTCLTAYALARHPLFPLRLAQGRHRTIDQGRDLRRDRTGDPAGAAVHGARGHRADDGQSYLVGWFALLLGTAFIVLFAVRRSKARR
jgi:hypothetical protein